jgi:NRPS condensation-like uncharacterized protein
LQFRGSLDEQVLRTALAATLDRHPLLRSMVKRIGGKWQWQPVADPQTEIVWTEGSTRGEFPAARHLSLEEEIGLRVFVVADSETADLTLQFHHSCCDGGGIFALIEDLLIAYQRAFDASCTIELPQRDADALPSRAQYGLSAGKLLRLAPKQAVGLLGAWQFLGRAPVPLKPHEVRPNDASPPAGYPAAVSRTIDAAGVKRLRANTHSTGVTWNDLLMRDLFLTLDAWRTAHGADPKTWLRMMIPMNLRTSSDRKLSAANVVSSVFIDRRTADCADPEALLDSIHEEMDLIKERQLGLAFFYGLKVCSLTPGGLRRSAREDKCTISCIFTNLGRLLTRMPLPRQGQFLAVGDAVLEDVETVARCVPTT